MKRKSGILCLLFALLFSFFGCAKKAEYPPVESTEEERATVMTMTDGNRSVDVPFELYRALFLTYRETFDGGDTSLWSKDGSDALFARINEKIFTETAEIYAALSAARDIGFDPYGKEAEAKISAYIKAGVEGGYIDGMSVEGHGSYEKYLAYLESQHLNYSVQVLLFRYLISMRAVQDYYLGTLDKYGNEKTAPKLVPTEEDLRSYYFGEDSVRVLWIFLDGRSYSASRAKEIRDAVAAKSDETAVANYMIGQTTTPGSEVLAGHTIGRYTLPSSYYEEVTRAAFSLAVGETSAPLATSTGTESGYYILYRGEKSEENFLFSKDSVKENYLQNEIGKIFASKSESMKKSAEMTKTIDIPSLFGGSAS